MQTCKVNRMYKLFGVFASLNKKCMRILGFCLGVMGVRGVRGMLYGTSLWFKYLLEYYKGVKVRLN